METLQELEKKEGDSSVIGTRINKIVLHGFKSFANRTELLFGDGFNVVLGPNGSGKSNILDGICFVLGKSSSRALRAEKAAHLIYNGGRIKQASKFGEVSIYFDNASKTFPLAEEEIKISRIVKPDGQSTYKINNKTRTRQQVLDILSIAKINPDGYNIILQGDIVRFVEMSSNERRQVVEEIAGISVYEEKKEKAMRELQKVEEHLKEAEIILNERQIRLSELKGERDQALKYKELNDKINVNKASYLTIQIRKKEAEKSELEKQIDDLNGKIQKIRQEIDYAKTVIQERKDQIRKITEDIEKQGEENQVKLNKEIEFLRTEIITGRTKTESYNNEILKIKSKREQLQKSIAGLEEQINYAEGSKSTFRGDLDAKSREMKEIEKKIQDFKKKNSLDSVGDIEKQVEEIDRTAEEKLKEIQAIREEQQNLLREKDRLEFQIQGIDVQIQKVIEIEKENKEQIDELKNKRSGFKKATLELNQTLNEDSSLAAQLNNAKVKFQKIEEDVSKLRVRTAGIKEKISGNEAVRRILENRSKFGEIYGTVAEIGSVGSKYALALEIAAGNKIRSIVVEDDAVAAKCIKYLKENRLGTAAFLPLNKIKGAKKDEEIEKLSKSNGTHGFASDLVSYDAKFKKVFSYVFGSTLVVDSIDVARRIGIGKVKMVTIDGDLAEFSGAMIGGYQKKERGEGFREKEIMTNLVELEKQAQNLQEVISILEKKKIDNERKIQSLRELKAVLEGETIKLEKSLHLEATDIDVSKKQKQLIAEQIKQFEKKLSEISSRLNSANRELTDAKIRKQEMRNRISDLRSPLLIAELTAFEQKRREILEIVMRIEGEIKNNDVRISNILIPEKEKCLQVGRQTDKEEDDFRNFISESSKTIAEKEKVLREKEKQAKKFYEQFREAFNKRTALQDETQKDEEKIFLKEDDIRKIEQKMNIFSIQNAEMRAVLSSLSDEFKKYGGAQIDKAKSESRLRKEIDEFERMVANIGMVNMRALEIYDAVEKEYSILLDKKEKLRSEKNDVLLLMNEIESRKKELFMKTFDAINDNFKKIFSELSTKGDAHLAIENPEDPFLEGILVKVKLSGAKFLNIKSLSGGEQTLTSLAVLFAIQEYEPASFYVMDEVDASLDKHNSEKLANLIKKYSGRAQYVVISHNDHLISEGDVLYGISMNEHGMSNVVSMRM